MGHIESVMCGKTDCRYIKYGLIFGFQCGKVVVHIDNKLKCADYEIKSKEVAK